MKNEIIKPLPIVTAYTGYFIRRAKKALKLTGKDFRSVSVDYNTRSRKIHVWFHAPDVGIVGDIYFWLNGDIV